MLHAHPAGALHAEGYHGPSWLSAPQDVNALDAALWAANVTRGGDGVLHVAGVPVTELAREFGTAAYILDEADFRARAADFRDAHRAAFGERSAVYYAGKAFLCTQVVRWLAEDGLSLDVCTGGELAVALRGGMPAERIGFHGNNKTTVELRTAIEAGVGRIIADSFDELDRISELAQQAGRQIPVMLRVTVGVEAHTHEFIATAHEDQKFGFSLAGGLAAKAVDRVLSDPGMTLLGLHSHIGSQIFDPSGFEVSARRVLGLHATVARDHDYVMPELDLGGGFGIAYTSQDNPQTAAALLGRLAEIVTAEARGLGVEVPHVSIEPGRAIAGPSTFTLYEVGTVKPVELDGGGIRQYVSVDGGMSDNIRTALYSADYSCTVAGRASDAPAVISRVVGRHCESGDIVVKDEFLPVDVRPGDLLAVPGTGAYCRSMASQYNHTPRPPVVAVRDGVARVVVRRETVEDLIALDVVD